MLTLIIFTLKSSYIIQNNQYSETCPKDHLRNRDSLGIEDTYFSPYVYLIHRNEPEKNKTTLEFRTVFGSPLGVPNCQVSLDINCLVCS